MGRGRALVAQCSHSGNDDDDSNVETEEISAEEEEDVEAEEDVEEEANEEESSVANEEDVEVESCEEESNEGEEPCEEDPSEEEEPCEEDPSEEEEPCEEDPSEEEGPCEDDPTEEEPCEEALNEEKTREESTEEPDEEPSEEDPSEVAHSPSDRDCGKEHQVNCTPPSSNKKRAADGLECNAQKRQKQDLNSNLEFDAGFSGTDIQDTPKNSIGCAVVSENQESIERSSKKRASRWDAKPGAGGESVDSGDVAAKRRKTRWSSDDTQLTMLGPLKLPDFVKGLIPESDLDPEIQKLKIQLYEINEKLMARENLDERPEKERSQSPPPISDDLGMSKYRSEARLRLIEQRQRIILDLIQRNPTFKPPPDYKPPKFLKKLYVPVNEYPKYNFIGLIMGPRGRTHKRMEKETGATILLRGKGTFKKGEAKESKDDHEDLHVHIEATTKESLDAAVARVEKLLVPLEEAKNEHKWAQLKELAETLKEEGTQRIQMIASKTNVPCEVCGNASHLTAACPLTAPTPGANTSGHQVGTGLFSPFTTPPAPTPAVPWLASPAPSALPSCSMNPVKVVDEANLYVAFLPPSVDENKLVELFSPFGQISGVRIIKDKSTGLSKGYGFVNYVDAIFAAEATARMNGYSIEGRKITVRVAGRFPSTVNNNTVLGVPQGLTHVTTYPVPGAFIQMQGNSFPMNWPGFPGSVLPNPYAPFPQTHGFLLPTDPMGGQSLASFGSFYQTPPSSSLISGGIVSSGELAQFPGYLNSLESSDLVNQMTPLNPGLPTQAHLTPSFGSHQAPPF